MLASLCLPQWERGGGGGERIFGEDLKFFFEGVEGGGYQNFVTDEEGVANFFPPLYIKIRSIVLWIFLTKEDHLNYSMLEESLLPYLLYKYTLYRTFITNIKVKCFYCKANCFQVNNLQLQKFQ